MKHKQAHALSNAEKRKEQFSLVFLVVIVVSLFASGMSLFGTPQQPAMQPTSFDGQENASTIQTSAVKPFKATTLAKVSSFSKEFVAQFEAKNFDKASLDAKASGLQGFTFESAFQRQGSKAFYVLRGKLNDGAEYKAVEESLLESLEADANTSAFFRFANVSIDGEVEFYAEADANSSKTASVPAATAIVASAKVEGDSVLLSCDAQIDTTLAEPVAESVQCYQIA